MLEQQLLNGIVLGSVYCLFALGFTIIFGVLHVINLVYGFYFAIGAYIALWLARATHLPIYVVLPLAAVTTGLIAVVIDNILLTPLRDREGKHLASLMITLGAALFLYSLMTYLLGAEALRFPEGFGSHRVYRIGGVTVTGTQVLILTITPVLIGGLFLVLRYSRWGVAVRAIADNEGAALLMGLNPTRITSIVSFSAGVLAGVAGVLIGLNFNAVHPYMGEFMMLRGFAVVIIGGLGNMPGAVIAGLALGILEILTAGYWSSIYREAITFSLLLLTLWFFPTGLVPQINARRP